MRYKGACSPLPPPPPYYDDYLSELSVSAVWLDVTRDIKVCWCKCKIVHDMTQLGTRDKSHRKFGMVRF